MEGKELTLQEKIDRAKPGDIIWHVVEDPNPLRLQQRPTAKREFLAKWVPILFDNEDEDETMFRLKLKMFLEELGVEMVDD